MEQSIKQKKIGKLLKEELSNIFQKMGLNMYHGGMITIIEVSVTPDLLMARAFLSFLNVKDPKLALEDISSQSGEIRKQLGNKIRNQVRLIPELEFHLDDSLANVFKIEEIFKKIKK